jgi:diguanylate cyclase
VENVIYFIPFTSACTLITLSYIALKLKNRLFMERFEHISAPILTGMACILLMLEPFSSANTATSLSFAPIVMAGLRYGWVVSLLSALLPSVYIYQMGLADGWMQIAQNLVIPAIVSALFHRKENDSGYAMIPFLDGIKVCVLLTVIRLVINGSVQQQPAFHFLTDHFVILIVSSLAMLVLITMYNDENRSWILQRRLEMQANQDGLTGLPNLRSFMNTARDTVLLRPISIMMIDIDNFKKYNDTFGHVQGDRRLKEIGQILRFTIDEHDYVARYGGEEFIIMSQMTDYTLLAQYAKKLCQAVQAHHSNDLEEERTTISIGISVAASPHIEMQRMISEADEALYASKDGGKNRYTFFNGIIEISAKKA